MWGIARFSDLRCAPRSRPSGSPPARSISGIRTSARAAFGLYVLLHVAADFGEDYERGLQVNAEGTGLLLSHCRNVKATLVMSTLSVYKPHPDPFHAFREDDPIGDQLLPSPRALLDRQDRRGGGRKVLRTGIRSADDDRPDGQRVRRSRRATPVAPAGASREQSGGGQVGSAAVQPYSL